MKGLIAAVAALVLLAFPATAEHRQMSYGEVVRWAGCTAALVTSDKHEVVESFYRPDTHTLYIGTRDRADLPQDVAEMVLLHEIGHCLQKQAGIFSVYVPRIYLELDADRWAADLACARHRDGKRLLHDIFVWAYTALGYEGDYDHGTLAQRIAQGDNAAMCKLPPLQTPLVTQ